MLPCIQLSGLRIQDEAVYGSAVGGGPCESQGEGTSWELTGQRIEEDAVHICIMQLDNIMMTVGLQKSTGDKVQYCITAL